MEIKNKPSTLICNLHSPFPLHPHMCPLLGHRAHPAPHILPLYSVLDGALYEAASHWDLYLEVLKQTLETSSTYPSPPSAWMITTSSRFLHVQGQTRNNAIWFFFSFQDLKSIESRSQKKQQRVDSLSPFPDVRRFSSLFPRPWGAEAASVFIFPWKFS